jgi:steroid delta-isomerase-like uncharacterized protein
MTDELRRVHALVEWADAWSAHDAKGVAALFTDDCVYEDIPLKAVNHGTDELIAFAEGAFGAFPDFGIKLTSQFATADWAGAEWTMTGTHKGDLPGLPATAKQFELRGGSILELREGKITRCTDYWDMADLLRQVGVMQ